MSIQARYVHTNLIAKDWKTLATFYENVLGCVPIFPKRDLSGKWLEDGTGIENAHVEGIHMRLPGYDENGPTLEIFQYNQYIRRGITAANLQGFTHITFAVDNVAKAREEVLKAGGKAVGEVVTCEIEGTGTITWTYVTDPEGNIIELQKRS